MAAPVLDTPSDHVYARMLTFRGVINNGNPIDATAGGVKAAASTSVTVTGVTTTVPNALVVQAVARDNDNAAAAFSAETNVNLTGITERLDAGIANGNGGGLGIWTGVKVAAGPTGNTTANVTSSINAFLTIALKPQAGPAYQAAGTAVSNATSVSPAWPAHATNDVALLFVESGAGEVVNLSVPAGFAPVLNSPQAAGSPPPVTTGTRLTVFWARATSAAMAAPTVTVPAIGNSHIYARIITYRGAATAGDPWDVTGGGVKAVASTAVSVTGITTTVADTLIVQAVARDIDSTAAFFSAQANAALTGIAERSDAGTTTGQGGGFAVWDGYKGSASATGNTTATVTNSINAFLSVALKPQAATVPVFGALGAAAVTGLNWPAHAVDDIALLFVESTGGQPVALAVANGFAAVTNSPQATGAGAAGTRLTAFWARATSTSMPGPVLSGTTDHMYARIFTYRGAANSGNPWDITGGGVKAAASTSVSVTGITTTIAGTRVVQAVTRDNDSSAVAFSGQTNANLAGIVERHDSGSTSGNGGGFGVWDGTMSLAAPTGNTTATVTSSINAFLSIALRPSSGLSLHHVRLDHPGTAVTCLPASVTVIACATADAGSPASCTPYTTGLTGNVVAKDVGNVVIATVPFVIGAGSSSVAVGVPVTTAQTATLETSALSVLPTTPWTCFNMGANNASCSLVYVDAGFIFSSAADGAVVTIPAQTAGNTSATYYLRAVRTSTTTKACEAALTASGTVNFGYTCNNPGTCSAGNRLDITPYNLGGVAQPAISVAPGSSAVTLFFDANGNARHTFSYRDAGQITINASKAAGGLLLTPLAGSTNAFVTAPASFQVAVPAPPFIAGTPFATTVTARTSGGATTPNFGQESVPAGATLTSSNPVPGLGNATAISSAASAFAAGVSVTNLTWNEVGTIDLGASASNYLGSGLNVSGSLAAVGPFIPGYFDTIVSHGCGSFTYGGLAAPVLAGQPFTVEVKAKRTGGDATDATNTANYAGATWAQDVTLSDVAAGPGTLANNTLLATDFVLGKRSQAVNYRFASKTTAPYLLAIRATAGSINSSTGAEGSTTLRSGRLRLQGAYGSDLLPLRVPLLAEYHDGSSWKPNLADTCTVIPTAAVAVGNRNPAGLGSSVTSVALRGGGVWDVLLDKPTLPGSADIALDLGTGTAAANVCLAAWSNGPSPAPVAASLSYLLGNWCGAGFDKAPLARIKFGSPKAPYIYLRERY
jgi:MSHA biogenesis protein MshQ